MKFRLLVLGTICSAALVMSGQSASVRSGTLPLRLCRRLQDSRPHSGSGSTSLGVVGFTVPESPTPQETKRQGSSLRRIGLSDADKSVLRQQLAAFAAAHARWNERLVAARSSGGSPQLNDEGWSIVEDTRQVLAQELSGEGSAKLAAFIKQAKAHMVVRP